MTEISTEKQVHVIFPLQRDEDGYPDFATERMWAVQLKENEFRITNSAFYVYGISWGDTVEAKKKAEDVYEFIKVKNYGGHSTFRFKVFKDEKSEYTNSLIKKINALGCGTETSGIIENFVTIDVPPEVDPDVVGNLLADEIKANGDRFDFEEASIPDSYISKKNKEVE